MKRSRSASAGPAAAVTFTLPRGYRDGAGELHTAGAMRALRAGEEISILGDFRVFLRPRTFLSVALARAVDRLGTVPRVTVGVIDDLHPDDRLYLEELYRQMNGYGAGGEVSEATEMSEACEVNR